MAYAGLEPRPIWSGTGVMVARCAALASLIDGSTALYASLCGEMGCSSAGSASRSKSRASRSAPSSRISCDLQDSSPPSEAWTDWAGVVAD